MASCKLFITFSLIAAVLFNELDAVKGGCSSGVVQSCWNSLYTQYTNSPTADSQVSTYCRNVSAICNDTLSDCGCLASGSDDKNTCLEFLGLKDAVKYICDDADARATFLKERTCIVTNVDAIVDTCRNSNEETCAGYKAAFVCFYDQMQDECGNDVANMMIQFELRRFTGLLSSVSCSIEMSVVKGGCSSGVVQTCWDNLYLKYTNSPTADSQVASYCSAVSGQCSDSLTRCGCLPSGSDTMDKCLEFLGLKDAVKYICDDSDARSLFLKERSCIVDNVDTIVQTCRDNNAKTCVGYLAAFQCFYDDIEDKCDEDVAEMMIKFEYKRFERLLASRDCTVDTSVFGAAAGVTASSVVIVSAAVSVLIQLLL